MTRGPVSHWAKTGALVLFLCLVAFGLVSLEDRQKGIRGPQRPTTYSAGPGGYKALYTWLKALGIWTRRWEKDLRGLPPDAKVLLLIQPEIMPTGREIGTLKRWVRRGNTLVLAARPSHPVISAFGLNADAEEPSVEDEKDLRVQPGVYSQQVKKLHSQGIPGMASSRPDVIFHIRNSGRGLLAVIPEGKGRIIAMAAPELFNNMALRDGHHARLALNLLLPHLGKGRLLVDEYHHGYGRVGSLFEHLARSGGKAALLHGLLLLLTLWAAFGRRFGPQRPIVPVERRSSMEHLQAIARLFQRAGARDLAMGALLRWTEEAARKDLLNGDRAVESALGAARKRVENRDLTDRELLSTVRGLYRALAGARRRSSAGLKR
jgi:hypothetical protein